MPRALYHLLLAATVAAAHAALVPSVGAQATSSAPAPLLRADSALLYDILSAEDRRDPTAAALAAGIAHADPRIAAIARRAVARMRDSTFAERGTLGQPDPSRPFPRWPEPEWADRYRALGGRDGPCAPLVAAFADSAVQVRQRAVALSGLRTSCVADPAATAQLRQLVMDDRSGAASSTPGTAAWPLRAEALVALARVAPGARDGAVRRMARHPQPMMRRAAARAATVQRDTIVLRLLLADSDGNVQEAAVRGLSAVVGLAAEADYRRLLGREVPQVALAAAEALRASQDSATRRAAGEELARRRQANHASERDIRDALRAILGEAPEPWAPGRADSLPWDAVALALGERRFVQVTMSRLYGGRAFTVELRGDLAPIQAARVLARVRRGGYDGTRWHRVEPNFVIQGGSPHDNEYSGSARFVVDELGTVAHPRGTVGMSTRGHSTGDLQWFVNLRDNARLGGAYTVFAAVVEGMEAVDAVMEGDRIHTMREVNAPRPSPP